MRCGVGYEGLQRFSGIMNMPPSVARKNYKISNKLGEAVEKVAKACMIQASVDVKENEITDIGISYDGIWQKRGYSSFP